MAEHYSFFDPVEVGGVYDREYNAQEFTDYFGALITTGVMKGAFNMLAVTANGSNMVTSVNTGIAFVEAKRYFNDAPLPFTHDTETIGLNRIDRIVIRMDKNVESRYVKAFVKKGTASVNPVPPTLTQTDNYYEISLAQIRIVGGQTFIASNAVTDERGTDIICPWAGSKILPNFDNEALEQLITDVETKLVDASTVQKGIVKLNDSLDSTSITEAPTSNAVNRLYNQINVSPVVLYPTAPFKIEGTTDLTVCKVGNMCVLAFNVTNTTQLNTSYANQLCFLPVNFRPLRTSVVGYGFCIVNGVFRYLPITIAGSSVIMQLAPITIPANTDIQGMISFYVG